MKKQTRFIMAGACLALLAVGCGQEKMPQDADAGSGQMISSIPDSPELTQTPSAEMDFDENAKMPQSTNFTPEADAPLWA